MFVSNLLHLILGKRMLMAIVVTFVQVEDWVGLDKILEGVDLTIR